MSKTATIVACSLIDALFLGSLLADKLLLIGVGAPLAMVLLAPRMAYRWVWAFLVGYALLLTSHFSGRLTQRISVVLLVSMTGIGVIIMVRLMGWSLKNLASSGSAQAFTVEWRRLNSRAVSHY